MSPLYTMLLEQASLFTFHREISARIISRVFTGLMMAYVPPHKRTQASEDEHNEHNSAEHDHNLNSPAYASNAISRGFTIGLPDENQQFPPLRQLPTVSVDPHLVNLKKGQKSMVLLKPSLLQPTGDSDRSREEGTEKPWEQMVEALMPDLLFCLESVRTEIENERFDSIEAKFVARAGTVLFLGNERTNKLIKEATLRKLKRMFLTDVPSSYMDNIMDNVVPKIGLHYRESKDVFHVTLLDKLRQGPAISCKCRVVDGEKRLELHKIDLKPVRHLVFDVSCLEKRVDLRLMLSTKKTLTSLTDDERKTIGDLIGSSIVDPTAEGGIRWPLENTKSSDNRYQVVRACHAVTKVYSNSAIRMKVRVAENSWPESSSTNFSGEGELRREMTLELKAISAMLLEKKLETAAIFDMLKCEMKLLWDHFLDSEKHFIM